MLSILYARLQSSQHYEVLLVELELELIRISVISGFDEETGTERA